MKCKALAKVVVDHESVGGPADGPATLWLRGRAGRSSRPQPADQEAAEPTNLTVGAAEATKSWGRGWREQETIGDAKKSSKSEPPKPRSPDEGRQVHTAYAA